MERVEVYWAKKLFALALTEKEPDEYYDEVDDLGDEELQEIRTIVGQASADLINTVTKVLNKRKVYG